MWLIFLLISSTYKDMNPITLIVKIPLKYFFIHCVFFVYAHDRSLLERKELALGLQSLYSLFGRPRKEREMSSKIQLNHSDYRSSDKYTIRA